MAPRVRNLLFASPCLLAVLAVVIATAVGVRRQTTLDLTYIKMGELALEQGKWDDAEICFERLADLGRERDKARLGMARAALGVPSKRDYGSRLLRELAPEDRVGYGPAHRLWAHRLLTRGVTQRTQQLAVLERARHHLHQAVEADPDDHAARHGLVELLTYKLRRYRQAERHLDHLMKIRKATAYQRAKFYCSWYAHLTRLPERERLLKKDTLARVTQQLGAIAAELEVELQQRSANPAARYWLGLVRALQNRFEESLLHLKRGWHATSDSRFRIALIDTYTRASQQLPKDKLEERFELLSRAFAYGLSPSLERELRELARKDGPMADRALGVLESMLVRSHNPAVVHLLLSSVRWERGDEEKAAFHLEAARKLGGVKMGWVLNNLAYIIAHRKKDPDLEQALKLSEEALQHLSPNAPLRDRMRLKDTRGRILAKLGRHKEALLDLEPAKAFVNDRVGLLKVLAGCYEAVGQKDLARRFEEEARTLEAAKATQATD